MTILVTGAAGFIGTNLTKRLLDEGYHIIAVDNLNLFYSPRRKLTNIKPLLEHEHYYFHLADITKKDQIESLFKKYPVDVVVHLAARAGPRDSVKKPIWYKEANVTGTVNLLELASRYKVYHFVAASSSSVYGAIKEYPFHEKMHIERTLSPYAATKHATEIFAYTYHHLTKMPITMLRFFTVYGPHARHDMMVFPFIEGIENGKTIYRNGDGSMRRSFTYIDDIVEGILKIIEKPQGYEIFNLGNQETVSISEAINYMETLMDKKALVEVRPHPPGDPDILAANTDKMFNTFGWRPATSFEEGLKQTIDWYRNEYPKSKIKYELPGVTKRVAVFSAAYTPFVGDAEAAAEHISNALDHYYFDIFTARMDRTLPHRESMGNAEVYRLGFGSKIDKYIFPFLSFIKAKQLHRKRAYDVAWGIMASYGGIAAYLFSAFTRSVKYLLSLQEGESQKFITTRTWFWYPLYRKVYTSADWIHAVSRELAQRARSYGYKGIVSVVPNGIRVVDTHIGSSDHEKNDLKTKLRFNTDDQIIISIARLNGNSAVADVVSALTQLPEKVKLLIIGEGKEKQSIKDLIYALRLQSRVRIISYIPVSELARYLNLADVFVRPSVNEGLGNSFLEAMLCTVPVVGTQAGGLKDFLIHEKTGLVCRAHDSADIARQVNRMLTDDVLRKRVTENAYHIASREYDWQTAAEGMKEIFEEL